MADYSNYQKKVIQRFYDNRDQHDEQRLAELTTELYLAEGKKRDRLWKSVGEALERLKIPPQRVAHVMQSADPAVLAEVVKDLQSGALKPGGS